MPIETNRLKLPLPLGNESVSRVGINNIFEKIDEGVATREEVEELRHSVNEIDIPDASLTQKGKVQLSNKIDGTSEKFAVTEKALNEVRQSAVPKRNVWGAIDHIMTDTIKALYAGNATTSAANVYTVQPGKYAVVKSMVITNSYTDTSVTFRLIVGGVHVAYDHVLEGSETLIINDLDIPLIEGETIQVQSSANVVNFTLSGFERDYLVADYNYSKRVSAVNSSLSFGTDSFNWLIKSILVCNPGNTLAKVTVDLPRRIMSAQSVKPYDTLIIPNANIFRAAGSSIIINTTTPIQVCFVLEKVVQ